MNVADLRGLYFLDTNVLVYSFDPDSASKQSVAQKLIMEGLRTQRGVISTQVVQEFLNVATRKFSHPLSVSESREYLRTVLSPLCRHAPSVEFYDRALLLREEVGYSLYDTLIVAAAVETGCSTLLSEDLQHGRNIRDVRIVNPFRDT
jgi:predicted nucleic acid-binding protein